MKWPPPSIGTKALRGALLRRRIEVGIDKLDWLVHDAARRLIPPDPARFDKTTAVDGYFKDSGFHFANAQG